MKVTAEVQDRVVAKIKECIDIVNNQYATLMAMPKITFDLKGRSAGLANYTTWHIRFNPVLLMENLEKFMVTTVPHELAHLACEAVYPEAHHPGRRQWNAQAQQSFYSKRQKRDIHGAKWQSIMVNLGVANPTRCHSYNTVNTKRVMITYTYACTNTSCTEQYEFSAVRHRIAQGTSGYRCGRCLTKLAWVQQPTKEVSVETLLPTKVLKKGTKIETCYALYQNYHNTYSREEMINVFRQEVALTIAGASTYYYTCQKRYRGTL